MKPGPAISALVTMASSTSLPTSPSASARGFVPAGLASTRAALVARSPCAGSRGGSTLTPARGTPGGRTPSASSAERAASILAAKAAYRVGVPVIGRAVSGFGPPAKLPRGVIGQLVLGQREADQQFEARARQRRANLGLAQRVDSGLPVAGPATRRDPAADVLRKRRRRPVDIGAGSARRLGAILSVGELQRDGPDALGDHRIAAADDRREIRQLDGPRAARIASLGEDVERRRRIDLVAGVVARAAHVG